jgi:hypothetical protein
MSNDGITNDSARRAWRARPPAWRVAAAIIAFGALSLLAAACGGSPSATSATSATSSVPAADSASSPSLVGYADCIRSHGVPGYPDPSDGQLAKGDAAAYHVSPSVFTAAQRACQNLLPNAGSFQEQSSQCSLSGDCPPAVVQQMLAIDRKFARCMRSHGVPNWPDPSIGLDGSPVFRVSKAGITHSQTLSPPMSDTIDECRRLTGANLTFGLG